MPSTQLLCVLRALSGDLHPTSLLAARNARAEKRDRIRDASRFARVVPRTGPASAEFFRRLSFLSATPYTQLLCVLPVLSDDLHPTSLLAERNAGAEKRGRIRDASRFARVVPRTGPASAEFFRLLSILSAMPSLRPLLRQAGFAVRTSSSPATSAHGIGTRCFA